MKLGKTHKKILIILGIIIAVFIIAIFVVNQFAASIIEGKIKTALDKNDTEYHVKIKDVGGNIFFGNIRVKDIEITPDSGLLRSIKEGTAPTTIAFEVLIPLLRITGVGIYDAIVNANIGLNSIEVKRAKIKIYKGKAHQKEKTKKQEIKSEKKFDPDSIYLRNVNGISVGKIALVDNQIQIWDLEDDKEIMANKLSKFSLTDFYISKYEGIQHFFYLDADSLQISISKEVFDLPGGDYKMSFSQLDFSAADSTLRIKKFEFKPTWDDKFKMAAQWKYTKEIFDVTAEEIDVHSINLYNLVTEGGVYIDSITVDKIDVNILKDKRYPFDESKRPMLPQQSLKSMKMPLYIGEVNIRNSSLIYQEKDEGTSELMTVELGSLNANISFITSIEDSIRTTKPMKAELRAKLMNKPTLRVDFEFPLHTQSDLFYFSGWLGATKLSVFDEASSPAIGVKFLNGNLQSLYFKASATATTSNGEMTMLYDNLQAEFLKNDNVSANKFMSWAANTVLRTGNPGKNGKTRVVEMSFDRVMYKGLGNFVWKTLQTGIVASITPAGKTLRHEQAVPANQTMEQKPKTQEENSSKKRKNKKKNSD
jgi:hypothetical protein